MKKLLLGSCLALMLPLCYAQGKVANVFDYELIGVKLGMSVQQAEEAIRAEYKSLPINLEKISGDSFLTNRQEVMGIVVLYENVSLRVDFTQDVSSPNMEPVVSNVYYSAPFTLPTYDSFISYADRKYGRASVSTEVNRGVPTRDFYWCTAIKSGDVEACETMGDNAVLQLTTDVMASEKVSFLLSTQKYNEALKRYREEKFR